MIDAVSRTHRKEDLKCKAMVWSQSSGGISSKGIGEVPTPALLTRMSKRPHSSMTRPIMDFICMGSMTSQGTTIASLPPSLIFFSHCFRSEIVRALSATRAPRQAKSSAVTAPMPREAPVTRATRSSDITSIPPRWGTPSS